MFNPKKAIVWGCNLHEHTNSYVYAAFYKAFKAMGFDAYWLTKNSDINGIDLSGSLFITEGQHDGNIPLRNDCKYVIHNCDANKYASIKPENRLILQVYTDDVKQWKTKNLGNGSYLIEEVNRCLLQPWATDLLPFEFNLEDAGLPRKKEIHWVGTYGTGTFGNKDEIDRFINAAKKQGISFHLHTPGSTSFEENRRLIQESYLAPSIHGTWQAAKGYIACRVFKNISYGHMGVTNSRAAYDLFNHEIIYCHDTQNLFIEAEKEISNHTRAKQNMLCVRDKHTYVNRIKTILEVLG